MKLDIRTKIIVYNPIIWVDMNSIEIVRKHLRRYCLKIIVLTNQLLTHMQQLYHLMNIGMAYLYK